MKNALETVDESDDDDSGCLLKKRVKTFKETTEEEDEYHEWLKGRRRDAKDVDDDLVRERKEGPTKPDRSFLEKPEEDLAGRQLR